MKAVYIQIPGQKEMLGLHHIPYGELRKIPVRLEGAVGGGRGDTVSEGIYGDHAIPRAVDHLSGSDDAAIDEFLCRSHQPGRNQDSVCPLLVQLPDDPVGKAASADDRSALQPQITEIRRPDRFITPCGSPCQKGHRGHEDDLNPASSETYHVGIPFFRPKEFKLKPLFEMAASLQNDLGKIRLCARKVINYLLSATTSWTEKCATTS